MSYSIIICSWQAPGTLDDALASIAAQKSPEAIETLVVNNGFSPARAAELQQRYPFIRLLDEPTPGLAHARRTGFRAASGEFFICIDDDNILGESFLSELSSLTRREPNLGCVCPAVVPMWEKTPPPWLQKFGLVCLSYNHLAVPSPESLQERIWRSPDYYQYEWPPGGGMIIHRSLAEHYLGTEDAERLKLGHVGNALGGLEDRDILSRIALLGRDTAYSERLLVYHQIPESRTRLRYLVRLNFRMSHDSAVFERMSLREHHPLAASTIRGHVTAPVLRLGGWARGKTSTLRLFLEWVRHFGFLYGWTKDALRGPRHPKE